MDYTRKRPNYRKEITDQEESASTTGIVGTYFRESSASFNYVLV